MSRINLVLYQPANHRFKILDAYLEVIDSLLWGLRELGYESHFLINQLDMGAVNIVFGWIPAFQLGVPLPPNSILYNLEQLAPGTLNNPVMRKAAAEFQIWDYSEANMLAWADLQPRLPVFYAPISYAPTLTRIARREEDIDMLYIGSVGREREEKLLARAGGNPGASMMILANAWGPLRDEFIGRAKVMLNISNDNPLQKVFEVVRVSYYMANHKAVVCESFAGQHVEADMREVLQFAPREAFGDAVDALLDDPARRAAYAQACFDVFAARDVRTMLRGFFG